MKHLVVVQRRQPSKKLAYKGGDSLKYSCRIKEKNDPKHTTGRIPKWYFICLLVCLLACLLSSFIDEGI